MGKNSLGYTMTLRGGNTWINYNRKSETEIDVKINDKLSGTIRKVDGGYQYFPKGHKKGAGQVYPSIRQVKQSIED